MGLFDKVGSFLKREVDDLGEAAESVKDKLDSELTRREEELAMSPSEKIAALQQQSEQTDDRLDAIANKAMGNRARADAAAEVDGSNTADLPSVTHIVLSDGQVRSGKKVVDDQGRVHSVPLVEAPSAEDLRKDVSPLPAPPAASIPQISARQTPVPQNPVPQNPVRQNPVRQPSGTLPPPPGLTPPDATPPAGDAAGITYTPVEPPLEPTDFDEVLARTAAMTAEMESSDYGAAPTAAPQATPAPTQPTSPAAPTPDLEVAPAPAPEPSPAEGSTVKAEAPIVPGSAADPSSADYGKTPAQIKYEMARAAADDLLRELRGELKDDGEI